MKSGSQPINSTHYKDHHLRALMGFALRGDEMVCVSNFRARPLTFGMKDSKRRFQQPGSDDLEAGPPPSDTGG